MVWHAISRYACNLFLKSNNNFHIMLILLIGFAAYWISDALVTTASLMIAARR
jgi:hypothetical protein